MGFEAVIAAIAETGKAAGRVTGVVRSVDPAAALPDGDAGMPGSRSAGKLAAVKRSWQGKGQATATALDQHAESIAEAAERYRAGDDVARRDLTEAARSVGGRKPV
ncbi:Excreted virulence factor EspC, type VII ESX diderm [Amycolatopsis arida]|uniref:Excreted virulence factor EspC, type VII ESX diderm n=1 Tax=Amycolatopsis arida TaxID=587909 RepID=A0A1I5YGV8_9PSEU|nr:type VII secretion target [Amycolatopsis arida]TDX90500.1 excreted virulence factor EspC (type VII ESX diderm) [Amycolatopsis arida]SFQ43360.1 Excreted virulence factor EspC, type VII ESX diderm [Amycolatopsis arida]